MSRQAIYAADIFSGCGGLSLGLERSGMRVCVAVDNDATVRETYEINHRGAKMIVSDVRTVAGNDLLKRTPARRLDVLAGCAPCQGFSSLTSKHRREDPRNLLVLELARLVRETDPAVVIMENVPGIARRGRGLLEEFIRQLKTLGYYVNWAVLQMADFGIPQNRRRFVLTAGKGFVVPLPKPTHARVPKGDELSWRTLRDAIGDLKAPARLRDAMRRGGPQKMNWHVVRDLEPKTIARLKAAIPGKTWTAVPEHLRPKCHQGEYVGFTNVYQRMRWDQLPVTITSGCTTPAKGRFGHPDRRRTTISVREAASLQTFPRDYKFVTDHMDQACNMIGNAVPPAFAQRLGSSAVQALLSHRAALRAARG